MPRRNSDFLSPSEIERQLNNFLDGVGSDSEYGGDSDAEDVLNVPRPRDTNETQAGAEDMDVESESDDSIAGLR